MLINILKMIPKVVRVCISKDRSIHLKDKLMKDCCVLNRLSNIITQEKL